MSVSELLWCWGIGSAGCGWLPVQEMVSTPGPKYSTMAPVPPLTVRMPATLQMMSLGEFHLASLPVSFTPITCKQTDALGRGMAKTPSEAAAPSCSYTSVNYKGRAKGIWPHYLLAPHISRSLANRQ